MQTMKTYTRSALYFALVFMLFLFSCKSKTIESKTMKDFGITASNLFLFYNNLNQATVFYTQTLGMELVSDFGMAKVVRMASDSYVILVDANVGMHKADEPKTVAIALITDQLEEWYDYIKQTDITIKYELKVRDSSAHDGFVIIDPEGYLLEFERFNEHPENVDFKPVLDKASDVPASLPGDFGSIGLSIKGTVTWLYYKDILAMKAFYEDILGLNMICDQGWVKIHQVSNTGFIGLVDEVKGMHHFTEKKAVNVAFIMDDLEGWWKYVNDHKLFDLLRTEIKIGPESRYKEFVGFDPEGYYMEFDKFYPHPNNNLLLEYLEDPSK
jgi:catechol 2,3-dioxygenase-like lactoylglutathione lyase family enzyme